MVAALTELLSMEETCTALIVGTIVALATAMVGVLTVLRGQSFAGHALTDLASVGGSAAFLLGINQFWGFVAACILSALGMHAIGMERIRGRDIATGVVLTAGMGLTALLLALTTQSRSAGNASMAVLFGSLFSVNPDIIPYVAVFAALCILALAVIWRPALLSTASPALARARGVRAGAVDAAFMIVLGIGVALGAVSVGAVLSTALLIGPAACGLRLFSRVRGALITACGLGVACVWGGIILSYESYTWLNGVSLSVSFCIVALILACYLVSRGLNRLCAMKRRKRVTHV